MADENNTNVNGEGNVNQTVNTNPNPAPNYNANGGYQLPPNMINTPLSMWAYFGYTILFSIPLVGFICVIVFSFGGTNNINLRNFARSQFCFFIVGLILAILLVILVSSGAVMYSAMLNR